MMERIFMSGAFWVKKWRQTLGWGESVWRRLEITLKEV